MLLTYPAEARSSFGLDGPDIGRTVLSDVSVEASTESIYTADMRPFRVCHLDLTTLCSGQVKHLVAFYGRKQ